MDSIIKGCLGYIVRCYSTSNTLDLALSNEQLGYLETFYLLKRRFHPELVVSCLAFAILIFFGVLVISSLVEFVNF